MAKRSMCTCGYCSEKLSTEFAVKMNNKYWHPECWQLQQERKELYDTICRIFHLKAPGPINLRLVKNYFEQGYTYRGMTFTLIYLYDIKQMKTDKAGERIGLIPYTYDEAQHYFEDKQKKINAIGNAAENFNGTNVVNTVIIEKQPTRKLLEPIKFTNPFEEVDNG